MTPSLKSLSAQIEAAEPGSSEMMLLLESIQELTDRAEALQLYDANDKQSMIDYLRKDPFYQGSDLASIPQTYLRKWCAEVAIERVCKGERVQLHHDEENEQGLL